MATVLFISPRFPYPPDRGEKIRFWHVLRHLARSHQILLGCLADDPADLRHLPTLEPLCREIGAFVVAPRWQKMRAALRLRPGRPLMLDYYDHPPLRRWINEVVDRYQIDSIYILSTAMFPYAPSLPGVPRILDMVDVDSAKWAAYGRKAKWPAALVWSREGRTLATYERQAALRCEHTLLVTSAERATFLAQAPDCGGRVLVVENGVDLERLVPDQSLYQNPYPTAGPWLTLVGNMDYWPNADAAIWCAQDILPRLQTRNPVAKLALVGANAGPELRRLANRPNVIVTDRVADVRPYLAHASVVVAPLRIARGVQNKVLEGMAMARPVVASRMAFEGIHAEPGRDLLIADDAEGMARQIDAVLNGRHPAIGAAARAAIEQTYRWTQQLSPLDALLNPAAPSTAR